MAHKIPLHHLTPHQSRVFDIVDEIRSGSIILLPTESQYAIACHFSNKKGIDRIRQIRNLDKDHTFTLLINNLTSISKFAQLSDVNFKFIKRLIPGPYTFILPATKEVPKLLLHPRRKTIGFRVPEYPICEAVLSELGDPMLAVSARTSDEVADQVGIFDREELFQQYDRIVDIMIDNDQLFENHQTSVIDLTGSEPVVLREGLGAEKLREVLLLFGHEISEEY
jgi:tRNA threonylcarbamoyl adenosine modification protein (Sua5/YciO/YrdC/YwlC family)